MVNMYLLDCVCAYIENVLKSNIEKVLREKTREEFEEIVLAVDKEFWLREMVDEEYDEDERYDYVIDQADMIYDMYLDR